MVAAATFVKVIIYKPYRHLKKKYTMLEHIAATNIQRFEEIVPIYLTSFPAKERREPDQLKEMLAVDEMKLMAYVDKGNVVGLLCYWKFRTFTFGEHIAIDSQRKGKGYGNAIMKELLASIDTPLLIEVEHPNGEEAIRRIRFYERLGLTLLDYDYQQPSYDGVKPSVSMALMSDKKWDRHALEQAVEEVAKTVYAKHY